MPRQGGDQEPPDDGPQEGLTAARQVMCWGDGAVAVVERDGAGGEGNVGLCWLAADGTAGRRPVGGPSAADLETAAGALASLDLAEAALAALDAPVAELVGATAEAAGGPVAWVAADPRCLAVLVAGEGSAGQAVLRATCASLRRSGPTGLDLAPLALGSHRLITGLALHAGWLYAFVADPVAGFDAFRVPATSPDAAFEPVLTEGAGRFALNAAVSAVAAAPEGLFIGTAALAPGPLELGSWGPELILLRPSGQWELLWGQPRFTPDGLKRPLSGRLPGPDRPGHAAVKAILPEVASAGGDAVVLVQDFAADPVADRAEARPDLFDYGGPARFLRSRDLLDWEEARTAWPPGLGAASSIAATAAGLLVGHEGFAGGAPPVRRLRLG